MAMDRYVAFLRQLSGKGLSPQKQPCHLLSTSGSITLGRDVRCQISLSPAVYRSVSRQHAEISPVVGIQSPDGTQCWQICDLGSSNGTFVNGKRVQGYHILRVGDRIMLGQNGPVFVFDYQPSAVYPVAMPVQPIDPLVDALTYPTAPTPRHQAPAPSDAVSMTQLFPIISTGRELAQKAYLVPAVVTISFVVLLFLAIGNPLAFNFLLASYLAIAGYYFIYRICGKHKPWWILLASALATALIVISPPALDLFTLVFHKFLPGDLSNVNSSRFLVMLVKTFFGAGLMEELLKAVPVLLVYWLGHWLRHPWRERVGVWEPLDGILLGAASAVGFALMETLGVYIPATYQSSLVAGADAAQLAGLQLLIPRVLGLVAGHIAYSGYLGYFIGLSELRRRQRWMIIGIGYVSASVLHTLWNVSGVISPVLLAIVGVVSYAFLGAAILKARTLSPTRSQNFATRFFR